MIGIDYDETFTADPDFWREAIGFGGMRGHRFICVTNRSTPPDFTREPPIPCKVICAGAQLKDVAARAAGYHVNVWIDDMPGLCKGSQQLIWDDVPFPSRKDHEVREAVNRLVETARTYHACESLRDRVVSVVLELIAPKEPT